MHGNVCSSSTPVSYRKFRNHVPLPVFFSFFFSFFLKILFTQSLAGAVPVRFSDVKVDTEMGPVVLSNLFSCK